MGWILAWILSVAAGRAEYGQYELSFTEGESAQLVSVRMHLRNAKDRPQRPRGLPFWHDHFAVDGKVVLTLAPGNYQFEVERGPEYRDIAGNFTIEGGATDSRTIPLERIVDMSKHGWWSGDLCVARDRLQMPLVMSADDLYFAALFPAGKQVPPAMAQQAEAEAAANGGRWLLTDNVLDGREGGRLGLYDVDAARLPVLGRSDEPPTSAVLMAADRAGARHIAAIDAAARDLPLWLASRRLQSILLLGPHLQHARVAAPARGWRARDRERFPDAIGDAHWTEWIYYQVLNCGLHIPPTAGSGSGLVPNPVGYNRVYAHLDGPPSVDAWWDAVHKGRVQVTNGPLLLPSVNGQYPGYTFRVPEGQSITLQTALTLYTRETIDYLELVQDGRVRHNIPLDRFAESQGRLPGMKFEKSGWMLIRAVTASRQTRRCVTTGPYYVEVGGRPSVSRSACQFFADWAGELALLASGNGDSNGPDGDRYCRAAVRYWQEALAKADRE